MGPCEPILYQHSDTLHSQALKAAGPTLHMLLLHCYRKLLVPLLDWWTHGLDVVLDIVTPELGVRL